MIRDRARRALIAAAATLACGGLPAVASAQTTHDVFADDTTGTSVWAPSDLTVAAGDTVRWRIEAPRALVYHDLEIDLPGGADAYWPGGNPQGGPVTAFEYAFEQAGTYPFVCTIHSGTMNGTIVVSGGGPGPPGGGPAPPGDDPEPLPNPSPPPVAYELGDNLNPRLEGLRVTGVRHGVRLRFWLSEPGSLRVAIKGKHGSRAKDRLRRLGAGEHSETIRDRRLDPGRHLLKARATDRAGNRARAQRTHVKIKG